jgi:hypothetical protein
VCAVGQMRIRENSESIAFYGGEQNEKRVLLDRFRMAIDNLSELVRTRSRALLPCAGSHPRAYHQDDDAVLFHRRRKFSIEGFRASMSADDTRDARGPRLLSAVASIACCRASHTHLGR